MLLENYKIILASQSPRRQELLKGIDIEFEVKVIPDLQENYPKELLGEEIPKYLANQKAEAYESILDDKTIVITADTIVWLNGQVYGKPIDEMDAKQMLRELSGKTHEVITGVCIMSLSRKELFAAVSLVKFAEITDAEIDYYIAKYKPMDKAGTLKISLQWQKKMNKKYCV